MADALDRAERTVWDSFPVCSKRRFTSKHEARAAHRHASYRIRVYRCEDCRGFHVTNNEKRHHAERGNDR